MWQVARRGGQRLKDRGYKMSFFELFIWSCWVLVAFCGLVAAVAWTAGAVAVLLSALVAGAAVSVVLVAVCWVWLKINK